MVKELAKKGEHTRQEDEHSLSAQLLEQQTQAEAIEHAHSASGVPSATAACSDLGVTVVVP